MQFLLKLGSRSPECSSGGSPDMAAIASSSNLVIGDSPEIFIYSTTPSASSRPRSPTRSPLFSPYTL
ncbi:MAG: hypothetical protein EBE86_019005 [Hormoscilla sp. GUM202]|nr:hypothetical protein [Hormoscilla sp. GUM202]